MSHARHDPLGNLPSSPEPHQDNEFAVLNSRVEVDVAAENARWVRDLAPEPIDHDRTVAELYGILVKMAYTETRRRGARIHLVGPELDDIAHQAAADVTLIVCRKVATFRGDCRFTTWAYRIVAFDVLSKVNRHYWQRAHVSLDSNDWSSWRADTAETPEGFAERSDLVSAVERIVREDLTERQQRAFAAITIRGLPVSQVAQEMDSNPNAIYKMMFDARKKLRAGLTNAGYLSTQS